MLVAFFSVRKESMLIEGTAVSSQMLFMLL